MKLLYESKMSSGRWMVYDVLGNAGWIAWIVCLVLLFRNDIDAFAVLAALPALLMLIGIAELTSERVQKHDPEFKDDEIETRRIKVDGFPVLTMLHKPRAKRANLFLIGGGMISAPRPGSIKSAGGCQGERAGPVCALLSAMHGLSADPCLPDGTGDL